MSTESMPKHSVTHLLAQWSAGDPAAAEELMPRVYGELQRIARSHFRRERADHTLQPTAVVHEAFLRLQRQESLEWRSRLHFLAISARLMRQVLVDHARGRDRLKRGGGELRISLEDRPDLAVRSPPGVLALDEALSALAERRPQWAQVVELRYFGGLTVAEAAEVLEVSEKTVKRSWRRARAWLYEELFPGGPHEP